MSAPEPDFREWGRRLLSKPGRKLPAPSVYAKREKIRAVISDPNATAGERQAAIRALERLDRKSS